MKTCMQGILLTLSMLGTGAVLAQGSVEGTWQGTLEVAPGNSITVLFDISQENGTWKAVLNSPDMGAIKNVPASAVSLEGSNLTIEVSALSGSYSGTLNNGTINGEWTQPGSTMAMNLAPYQAATLSDEAMATLMGQWLGKLVTPGLTFNMVFHFERNEAGEFVGFVQNADAGPQKQPMTDITLDGQDFLFRVGGGAAEYRGTLSGDTITGKLKQGPQEMELNVERGEYVAVTPTLSLTDADYEQLAGKWSGQLGPLTLVLRVERNDEGTIVAFIDSPTQGATDLLVTSASLTDGQLAVALTAPPASYGGALDGNTITGSWTQGGMSNPLTLTRE